MERGCSIVYFIGTSIFLFWFCAFFYDFTTHTRRTDTHSRAKKALRTFFAFALISLSLSLLPYSCFCSYSCYCSSFRSCTFSYYRHCSCSFFCRLGSTRRQSALYRDQLVLLLFSHLLREQISRRCRTGRWRPTTPRLSCVSSNLF